TNNRVRWYVWPASCGTSMLEVALDAQRSHAGKSVAKRRRMNGSLEEGVPVGGIAPAGFDSPEDAAEAGSADLAAPEQTDMIDQVGSRLPPAPANVPVANAPPVRPDAPTRKAPPEAIPIGNPSLATAEGLPMTPLEMRIRRLEDALAQL